MRLGVGVFRAVADERYDLILDTGQRLLRVQCKTAVLNGDVVLIRCYSCRRTAGGQLKRSYTSEDVDVIVTASVKDALLLENELIIGNTGVGTGMSPPLTFRSK
mgnify:CR=1 FL=1